jgi:hypothetical protein
VPQPFGRIACVTVRKKFKAAWKENKSVKHIMVRCAKNHTADTCRMCNPTTKAISETRDVALWAEWKKVDPKSNMSIFNQEPDLLNEPMGLDAVEVTEPLEVPGVDLHLIPDDDAAVIPDSEAGRIAAGEENAARGASENSVTSDETAREAASDKAKKLEREMKKLSWDSGKEKPAMNKAAVIEFDKDGNEIGEKEIHFVCNSELMTECGEPKTF